MTDKDREDWERSLLAFLRTPPPPAPKGARARRVQPRKPRRESPRQRCAYTA